MTQATASEMYAGWWAAENGEPLDETQSIAWVEGWELWHSTRRYRRR